CRMRLEQKRSSSRAWTVGLARRKPGPCLKPFDGPGCRRTVKPLLGASLVCLLAAVAWSLLPDNQSPEPAAAAQPRVASAARAAPLRTAYDFEREENPRAGLPDPEQADPELAEEPGEPQAPEAIVRGRVVPQLGQQPDNVSLVLDLEDGCRVAGPDE